MEYSAQLRSLLRAARVNGRLERHRFGVGLQAAMGAPSVREALAAIAERAFEELGAPYALHRQVLLEFTIRQNLSRETTAKRCGISVRRLFYVYAESVAILERRIQDVLQTDQRTDVERLLEALFETDPQRACAVAALLPAEQRERLVMRELHARVASSSLDETPPQIPQGLHGTARAAAAALCAWALELRGLREEALRAVELGQSLRYDHLGRVDGDAGTALLSARAAIARHDGDAAGIASLAVSDRADDSILIEAALAAGDTMRARGVLDAVRSAPGGAGFRSSAITALHRARIDLISGNYEEAAREAGLLIQLAQPHGDIRDMARIVWARATALLRRRIDEEFSHWHGDWHRLYYAAIVARSRREETSAQTLFTDALTRGYLGIAAHAGATVAWLRDEPDGASDAWRLWMRGRHFDQGFDLMPTALGTAPLYGPAMRSHIRMAADRDCADWPVHALIRRDSAADRFWQTVLHAATGAGSMRAVDPMITALLAATDGVTAITSTGGSTASARRLAKCISVAVPYEKRPEFIRRFTGAIAACNARALRSFRQTRARVALKAAM